MFSVSTEALLYKGTLFGKRFNFFRKYFSHFVIRRQWSSMKNIKNLSILACFLLRSFFPNTSRPNPCQSTYADKDNYYEQRCRNWFFLFIGTLG